MRISDDDYLNNLGMYILRQIYRKYLKDNIIRKPLDLGFIILSRAEQVYIKGYFNKRN